MKEFKIPMVEFVSLPEEDVIVTSGNCPPYTCRGYRCDECGSCTGVYYCDLYEVK